MNNDSKTNVADVVVLQKYLVKMPVSATSNLDVNGDGKVTVFDLIMLKRMILKAN